MQKPAILILVATLAVFLGATEFFFFKSSHVTKIKDAAVARIIPKNVYAEFIGEIYDLIKTEHWEELNNAAVSDLFFSAAQKLGHTEFLKSPDKEGVKKLASNAMKSMDSQKKKEFTVKLADMVLQSLRPAGRSRLYAQVNEEALKNLVANIDPNTDLYKTLGVSREAPQEEVRKNYEQKVEESKKEEGENPERAKKKLAEADRAYEAIKTPERRELYDKYKIEPTVDQKFIKPGILYIPIKKISPYTFEEFKNTINNININIKESGDALILDLRGNIGGSIDLLPKFLGPFIGKGRYAFEFYRRGKPIPVKTETDWLPGLIPYKNIVILIDQNTQSSAEIIASTLKKYNVGVLVGTKTKGWGTIERVFKLKTQIDGIETYSIFLVHTLTLREDGQPIEGRGVEPVVDITKEGWDKELFKYVRRNDLIEAIRTLWL